MKYIGSGIFTWSSDERRSKRYGYFYLDDTNYEENVQAKAILNDLSALVGKKVHVLAEVIETRKSGHIGDLAIRVFPLQPAVGDIIDLGVGILHVKKPGFTAPTSEIGLLPGDGRRNFWIDPRQLFRLHDQTVRLVIEPTDAAFTEPSVFDEAPPGVYSNGDNTFQYSRVKPEKTDKLGPRITPLGDGMFLADHNHRKGDRINLLRTWIKTDEGR